MRAPVTQLDLEERLRTHFSAIREPVRPPALEDALRDLSEPARRSSSPNRALGTAAALAALALVVVAVGIPLSNASFSTSGASSPSETATTATSPSDLPTPTPTSAEATATASNTAAATAGSSAEASFASASPAQSSATPVHEPGAGSPRPTAATPGPNWWEPVAIDHSTTTPLAGTGGWIQVTSPLRLDCHLLGLFLDGGLAVNGGDFEAPANLATRRNFEVPAAVYGEGELDLTCAPAETPTLTHEWGVVLTVVPLPTPTPSSTPSWTIVSSATDGRPGETVHVKFTVSVDAACHVAVIYPGGGLVIRRPWFRRLPG